MPKERMEDNAEYQRKRTWSQDERNIAARDNLAKTLHEHNQRTGQNSTFEQAHKQASEAAERHDRKKSEGE